MMRARVLMAVHAHPDDESSQTGGTLARYAAAGYRTVLVTCTDGGQGDAAGGLKAGQPGHDPHQVATERSRELDLAAAALGVHAVVKLGYPDSGVSDGGERGAAAESFSLRPVRPMVARLVRLMQLYRPEVLVTYQPNGFSGHPDHIRTHDLVVAAHRHLIANGEVEAESSPAPRLYYIALSKSRLRGARDRARAALGADAWVPPAEMAIDDAQVTTVIDVAAFWPDKLRAMAAHASQSDAAALLQMFSAADESVERVEEYVRAFPTPAEGPVFIEDDFFNDGR